VTFGSMYLAQFRCEWTWLLICVLPQYLSGWEPARETARLTEGGRINTLMRAKIGRHLSRAGYRAQAG